MTGSTDIPPPAPGARRWPVLVGCALTALVYHAWMGPYFVDDAYINLRYADHVAQGHGPVFNPGEEPVEGLTSLFWVLSLAFVRLLGVGPEASMALLTASSAVALLVVVSRADRIAGEDVVSREAAVAAAWLVGMSAPFLVWIQGGMDAMTGALLVTTTVLLHARVRGRDRARACIGIGLLASLAYLSRPEMGLLGVALVGDRLLRREWRNAAATAGALAVIGFGHLGWRLWFYGDYVPNTARIKVGGFGELFPLGVDYVAAFAWSAWPLLLLVLIGLLAPSTWRGVRRIWAVVPLAAMFFVAGIGGDTMPGFRFLMPVVPLLALLAGTTLAAHCSRLLLPFGLVVTGLAGVLFWLGGDPTNGVGIGRLVILFGVSVTAGIAGWVVRRRRGDTMVASRVGLAMFAGVWAVVAMEITWRGPLAWYQIPLRVNDNVRTNFHIAPNGRAIGEWLAADAQQRGDEDAVVAVEAAGAAPYFSGLTTLDMLGLNDRHIAMREMPPQPAPTMPGHGKNDATYVFASAPRYILFGDLANTEEPVHQGGRELVALPGFAARYEKVAVPITPRFGWDGRPVPFVFYVRVRRDDVGDDEGGGGGTGDGTGG